MLLLLPILTLALLWLWRMGRTGGARRGALDAGVMCYAFLVAMTEGLSYLYLFQTAAVAIGWGLALGVVGWLVWRDRQQVRAQLDRLRGVMASLTPWQWACAGAVAFLALFAGATAVISPPVNGDVIAYHLPRVMHWIQNQTVDPFPCHDFRMISMAPGGGYAISHVALLTQGDYFYNCVQWMAYLYAIMTATLIGRELGGNRSAQLATGLLAASTPLAYIQASTCQTDLLVAALSLICVAYMFTLVRDDASPAELRSVLCGMAGGLAVLVKPTGFVYMSMFGVVTAGIILWRYRWNGPRLLLLIGLMVLATSAWVLERNYRSIFIMFPSSMIGHTTEEWSPRTVYTNFARQAMPHLAMPVESWNETLRTAMDRMHGALGMTTTEPYATYFETKPLIKYDTGSDSRMGAPIHFLLFMMAGLAALLVPRRYGWRVCIYTAALAGVILTFCLLVKMTGYPNRFQTMFFLAATPVTAIVGRRLFGRVMWPVMGVLVFLAIVPVLLFANHATLVGMRSMVGLSRTEMRFHLHEYRQEQFERGVAWIEESDVEDFGLIVGPGAWEYTLWAMLEQRPRMHHVHVANITMILEEHTFPKDFDPELYILIGGDRAEYLIPEGVNWKMEYEAGNRLWVVRVEEE